jgi:hypothetical protein
MLEAYNYFVGGYLPKVPPKASVHKKKELKKIYNDMVSLNSQSPLVMLKLSDDKQEYALAVKELSMELNASTKQVLSQEVSGDERQKSLGDTINTLNLLLDKSDEFGEKTGNPSRPGGELRDLIHSHSEELLSSGIQIGEGGHLSFAQGESIFIPSEFIQSLQQKSQQMSLNPLAYVDKKIFSYGFISSHNQGTAYSDSIYSGMLFNSYC